MTEEIDKSLAGVQQLNRLRYYRFIAGLLANQQHDPLCSKCKAFTNTVQKVQQEVAEYMMTDAAELPALFEQKSVMQADIKRMLDELHPEADAIGQKKAGNCMLPQGVCFVKTSRSLIERICP